MAAVLSVGVHSGAHARQALRSYTAGPLQSGDRFGSSVALTGNFRDGNYEVAVGAPGCDWMAWEYGCVFTFSWTPGTNAWVTGLLGGIMDRDEKQGAFESGTYMRSVGYADSDLALDTWMAGSVESGLPSTVSNLMDPYETCGVCPRQKFQFERDFIGLGRDGVGALGDLDQNGAGDYAVRDGQRVRVLFNTAAYRRDPSVESHTDWDLGSDFGSGVLSAIGDLDLDGVLDLVFSAGTQLKVAFMNASGLPTAWQTADLPPEISEVPGFGRVLAPAGDVDLDGVPDLWVGLPEADEGRGAIALLLFTAEGRIGRSIRYDAAEVIGPVEPGDAFGASITSLRDPFGLGRPEIFVGSPGADVHGHDTGAVHVLDVSPDGSLAAMARIDNAFAPLGGLFKRPTIKTRMPDFDGDGIDDYFAASDQPLYDRDRWWNTGEIGIFLANADGSVRDRIPIRFEHESSAQTDRQLNLGYPLMDFDGDGRVEVAAVLEPNWNTAPFYNVILYLNADGTVRRMKQVGGTDELYWLYPTGDETGDGVPDLLAIGWFGHELSLVQNDLSDSPEPLVVSHLSMNGFGWWAPPQSLGDINSDGLPDLLVVTTGRPSRFRTVFGQRPGGPDLPPVESIVDIPGIAPAIDIRSTWVLGTTGDLDGDGCPEVILEVQLFDQSWILVMLTIGPDGRLKTARQLAGRDFSRPRQSFSPTEAWNAGDSNGDGYPDLAVRYGDLGEVRWFSIAEQMPMLIGSVTIGADGGITAANKTNAISIRSSWRDPASAQVRLKLRPTGDFGPFYDVPLARTGDKAWGTDLSGIFFASGGIEYMIETTTSFNLTTRTPVEGYLSTRSHWQEGINRLIPSGTRSEAYRIVGLPIVPDDDDLSGVITRSLSDADPSQWRLFLDAEGHMEYDPAGPVRISPVPGRGFWLLSKEEGRFMQTGPGKGLPTHVPAAVPLVRGWNLVANPYPFAIPEIGMTTYFASREPSAWRFEDYWSEVGYMGELQPFEGLLVHTDAMVDSLYFRTWGLVTQSVGKTDSSVPDERAGKDEGDGWTLRASATRGEARDVLAGIGMHPAARGGIDEFDRPEPPPIGAFVGLSLVNPEVHSGYSRLSRDIRPVTAHDTWEFEVTSATAGMVVVAFDGLDTVPPDLQLILEDRSARIRQDLRANRSYRLAMDGVTARTLSVEARRSAGPVQQEPALEFALHPAFPNPFAGATTLSFDVPTEGRVRLEVVDLLGRTVARLVDGPLAAGRHVAVWDAGRAAPGAYWARLEAGDRRETVTVVRAR